MSALQSAGTRLCKQAHHLCVSGPKILTTAPVSRFPLLNHTLGVCVCWGGGEQQLKLLTSASSGPRVNRQNSLDNAPKAGLSNCIKQKYLKAIMKWIFTAFVFVSTLGIFLVSLQHAVVEGGKPAPGGEDVQDPGGARRRDACLPWAPHAIQASTCDALLLARPAPPWVWVT